MIREDFKLRSQVKVISEYNGKQYCRRTYRFNYIPDPIIVPYCSWANLDCCGAWGYDEDYLATAVQKELKLFAGLDTPLKGKYFPDAPTLEEAKHEFGVFKESLPSGFFAEEEKRINVSKFFYTFVCREGNISDYINLEAVFGFYKKLGRELSSLEKREVEKLCSIPIKAYGTTEAPFLYTRAATDVELVTTGLLLGYPIESTVSIIQGY